ncbi:hypothetical protein [Telmatospirillum sp.]|uniref:hypothetical protein n=1 Tax=Telmatospirillum sp. TaxID=2079197 RepID=UPI0028521BE5|nr:hypothetical protein [Telmatospirillum sp.]MDR3440577.1 hypothetical protein [Telmatospirillum sp.]
MSEFDANAADDDDASVNLLADALQPRLASLITQEVGRSIGAALEAERPIIVKAVEQSLAGALAGSAGGGAATDAIARLQSQISQQYRDFTALLRQPAGTTATPRDTRRLAGAAAVGAIVLLVFLRFLPAGLVGSLVGIAPDRGGGLGALMVDRAGPAFQKCLSDARAANRAVSCSFFVAP